MNRYCLIISGPAGSGKTTIASKMWRTFEDNPAYICLDTLKHLVGNAISTDHYLDLARENGISMTKNFLKYGHNAIIEKAFGNYDFVEPFINIAKEFNVPSHYFKLDASLETLLKRNRCRKKLSAEELIRRGEWLEYSSPDEKIIQIYDFFKKHEHSEGIEINSESNSVDDIIKIIRKHINI
jgi:predicted kinase